MSFVGSCVVFFSHSRKEELRAMFAASLGRWNSLSNTCSPEGKIHSQCHCSVFMFLISSSLSYQYNFCCSLAETSSTSLRSNVYVCEYVFIHMYAQYCCILFALSSYSSPVSMCDSANTSALPTWCKVIKEHSQIPSLTLSPFITPDWRGDLVIPLVCHFPSSTLVPLLVSPLKHNPLVDYSKQWLFCILPCFV